MNSSLVSSSAAWLADTAVDRVRVHFPLGLPETVRPRVGQGDMMKKLVNELVGGLAIGNGIPHRTVEETRRCPRC